MSIYLIDKSIQQAKSDLDRAMEMLRAMAEDEAKNFAKKQSTGIVLNHEKGFVPRHKIIE